MESPNSPSVQKRSGEQIEFEMWDEATQKSHESVLYLNHVLMRPLPGPQGKGSI